MPAPRPQDCARDQGQKLSFTTYYHVKIYLYLLFQSDDSGAAPTDVHVEVVHCKPPNLAHSTQLRALKGFSALLRMCFYNPNQLLLNVSPPTGATLRTNRRWHLVRAGVRGNWSLPNDVQSPFATSKKQLWSRITPGGTICRVPRPSRASEIASISSGVREGRTGEEA